MASPSPSVATSFSEMPELPVASSQQHRPTKLVTRHSNPNSFILKLKLPSHRLQDLVNSNNNTTSATGSVNSSPPPSSPVQSATGPIDPSKAPKKKSSSKPKKTKIVIGDDGKPVEVAAPPIPASRLGPKANAGVINENLRALDRSGKPCREMAEETTHATMDEEEENNKRKRNKYVTKACVSCKRRKVKCDGMNPCMHCQTVSVLCEYVEGKARGGARRSGYSSQAAELSPAGSGDDVQERLAMLERKVEELSQRYYAVNPSHGSPSLHKFATSLTSYDHTVTGSVRSQSTNLRSPNSNAFYGQSSSIGTLSNIRDRLCSMAPASSRTKAEAIIAPTEAQVPELPNYTALQEPVAIPDRQDTLEILDTMCEDLMSMYPLLHPPSFYHTYAPLWNAQGEFQRDVAFSDQFSPSEIGLLYACLASTAVLNNNKSQNPSAPSVTAHKYYLSTKMLILDNLDKAADLPSIQAMAMLALYFLHVENEDASYKVTGMAIRMAFEMGIHLRSREAGHSGKEIELRRRAWYCLYLLDRRTSIALGRPCGVQNTDMDLDFPTPLDDRTLFPQQLETPIVLEHSKIPYLIHFVRFSSICGDIHDKHSKVARQAISIPLSAIVACSTPATQAFIAEVPAGTILTPGGGHHRLVDFAIRLSAEIIHTISLVKRTSDLVEMLWYPSKQMLLTTIMIIFSVVLNFSADTKFSSLSLRADLRVALQLLKDFSEKSAGSKKNLREIQFLRYLLNQALKSQTGTTLSASSTPAPFSILPSPGGMFAQSIADASVAQSGPFDMSNYPDLAFLDMQGMNENDLLMDLLDSMGERSSGQMFLST
ncbi:hypothetical protein MRB53_039314 [Persea americana]|nr:hypothetical protein MRB53_039314 [Persea americana]